MSQIPFGFSKSRSGTNTGAGFTFGNANLRAGGTINTFSGFGVNTLQNSTSSILSNITSTGQFNINNITKFTRFSDLPESIQNELAAIDKHIQNQKKTMSFINSMALPNIKSQIKNINNAAYDLFQKIIQLNNDLQNDQENIKALSNETYVQTNYMEGVHQFYNAASRGQTDDIRKFGDTVFLKYFYDLILSFENKLQQYEINIEELDRQILWLNSRTKSESEQDLKALSESLHNQHDTLMSMTGKVASMHENVEKLRQKYLNHMRTNCLDQTNPFKVTTTNQQHNKGGNFYY